jgi:hypothetical protein
MSPPFELLESTVMVIDPLFPVVASPVSSEIKPDAPFSALPVLNDIPPLWPEVPELAVLTVILPLDVAVPVPDVTEIAPPDVPELSPLIRTISLPSPLPPPR